MPPLRRSNILRVFRRQTNASTPSNPTRPNPRSSSSHRSDIEISLHFFNTSSYFGVSEDGAPRRPFTYDENLRSFISGGPRPSVYVPMSLGGSNFGNRISGGRRIIRTIRRAVPERRPIALTSPIERELEARVLLHGVPHGDDMCPICLDALMKPDDDQEKEICKIVGLDCTHKFHHGCIKNWVMRKNACPLCRTKAFA